MGHCRGEINMPARISPLVERRLLSSHSHKQRALGGRVADEIRHFSAKHLLKLELFPSLLQVAQREMIKVSKMFPLLHCARKLITVSVGVFSTLSFSNSSFCRNHDLIHSTAAAVAKSVKRSKNHCAAVAAVARARVSSV